MWNIFGVPALCRGEREDLGRKNILSCWYRLVWKWKLASTISHASLSSMTPIFVCETHMRSYHITKRRYSVNPLSPPNRIEPLMLIALPRFITTTSIELVAWIRGLFRSENRSSLSQSIKLIKSKCDNWVQPSGEDQFIDSIALRRKERARAFYDRLTCDGWNEAEWEEKFIIFVSFFKRRWGQTKRRRIAFRED